VVVQTIDFETMDELQSVELKRSAIRATGASHEMLLEAVLSPKTHFSPFV
jgi:hypothetical protein